MRPLFLRARRACAILIVPFVLASATRAQEPAPAGPPEMQGSLSLDVEVIAQRLDVARERIEPSLGASTYKFTRAAIANQPQGDNASLNEVLLQAPGVAQDSFGQLHVRGDHANLQYRLNGVQLPEGINVFGQALETRLANSVTLITGALPAQYGFRTAGIIDIQTKTGTIAPGGSVSMYGGTHDWLQPSFEWGGRVGQIDYFVTGEYLHNGIGIENPTGDYHAIHDRTDQGRGLAYVSGILDPTTRLTAILGTSRSQFQIPNRPNGTLLGFTVNGISDFNSAQLNENQRQITHYGIAALQQTAGDLDYQVSAFTRYSSAYFSPDPLGDILYSGIAQSAYRRSIASGTQGDASYRLLDDHTLRAGYFAQGERSTFATNSSVLPLAADGSQLTDQPFSIPDGGGKTGWLYGAYLQDEWKPFANLTVNFGARFDLVDEFTHENQLSPRINVVWEPVAGTTLHAGYARYFTPPPFELISNPTIALFAGTSAAPAVTQNDPVKAERSHYFDIGAQQVVVPGLKVGLDAYYKIAKNLIDEGQFGAPILLTPFNYARGFARGIELTSSYDIDNWSLYANFAVNQAEGEDIISSQFNFGQDELDYIAKHFIHLDHDQTYTASAGVAYTIQSTRTKVSASVIFGSGLRTSTDTVPNGASLPDYEQVNLGIVQKIDTGIFQGLEARLDIINLLDLKYQIRNGNGVGVGASQYGPRRTILAGLTQHF
jgi:outer membrane receptor protein involved in Fe transport